MTKNKKLRIVLDANWYVSACISRNSRRTLYFKILKNSRLNVFYSAEIMTEFEGVIERLKFAKTVTHQQVNRFKSITLAFLKKTSLGTVPDLVRDQNDNYLLGVCEGCQADFLITGDQDLLVLKTYNKTKIIKMGQLLTEISTY